MKKTRMDIFLLAGLLIVGLLLACFVYLPHGENGSVVEVRIKGKVTATYPLSSNIEKTITTEAGDSNTFCIKDQKVTMTHASCPDQICVRTKGFQKPAKASYAFPIRLSYRSPRLRHHLSWTESVDKERRHI